MWKNTLACLCLCVSALAQSNEQVSKLVNTTQGPVLGYKDTKYGIFSFVNIPYATAPTGPNKFKAPLPPPVWEILFDGIDKGIIVCPQSFDIESTRSNLKFVLQEDCLIANVYIPDTEQTNLPVVVYVHGGSFRYGYGNNLVYEELVSEHNIIAVTFNYRIGIHGFLCLGTEDVPGNAGMKDQLELLRWVKRNIASFGGNPDDVTLAGYSAGSASVDLHMLSKSADGLFNKVIPESGVSTALFTIQLEPIENAKWFAMTNNFSNVDDIYALEQFYKTAPFEVLTDDSLFERTDGTLVFTPCLEQASEEAFLYEFPVDILKNNAYKKVPVLHGFTDMEGMVKIELYESWKSKMNDKFSDFLPGDLTFESETQKEEVAESIKEFYFGDKPVGNDNVIAYVDYFSDVLFSLATLRNIRMMVENGHDQIYLYEYSFVDDNSPVVPYTNIKGAGHCAQSEAVAGQLFTRNETTEEFNKVSSTMRQLWANFIKTGKPVPEGSTLTTWPAVSSAWSPHMSINNTLQLSDSLLERRTHFWDDIYENYYRNGTPCFSIKPHLLIAFVIVCFSSYNRFEIPKIV